MNLITLHYKAAARKIDSLVNKKPAMHMFINGEDFTKTLENILQNTNNIPVQPMMKCNCGKNIPLEANFCPFCRTQYTHTLSNINRETMNLKPGRKSITVKVKNLFQRKPKFAKIIG